MTDQSDSPRGTRILIIAATFVIILWGINQAQAIVVLSLVSAFLAIIGTVPVHWMQWKGISSVAAVLIVLGAMVVLLLSVGAVLDASLNDVANVLPSYQIRIQAKACL